MIPQIIQEAINKGAALKSRHSVHYPARFKKKVPLKVLMVTTVSSDLPLFLREDNSPTAVKLQEYYVSVNSYGPVTALFEDGGSLGLKPDEFEVVEYHP